MQAGKATNLWKLGVPLRREKEALLSCDILVEFRKERVWPKQGKGRVGSTLGRQYGAQKCEGYNSQLM